ncbi:MAG: hypothetical protein R3C53_25175 [Pirellulaceae bacterium]
MARYDDLDTTTIAYTTFVSCILLLIIILLGRALCYAWIEAEDDRKLANARYESSDQLIREQKAKLAMYEKVQVEVPPAPNATTDGGAGDAANADPAESDAGKDKEPEIVTEERLRIPIDQAKALLLKELGKSPTT